MKITENFTYIGTQQNFERDSYATLAEMKAVVDKRMPDIFTATCKETGKLYIYNKNNEIDEILGKWREVGIDGDDYVTKTYVDTEIAKKADIDHTHTTVNGHTVESDVPVDAKFTDTIYDDTDIKAEIAKKADLTSIPSKVSELTNDSNYQTAEQVSSTVTTEIAKVVANAPEDFDTLKEMSDWIAGHENDASAMNSAISDNTASITSLQSSKADKSEIPTTVAELTDSADYAKKTDLHSHTNKTVLDGITSTKVSNWDSAKTHADSAHAPSNAQANVIEIVKVNGTALEVSDKAVNVTVPTTVAELTDSVDYAKKTDIPTTLPANGGNADTVNNHTVETDVPTDAKFTDTVYDDTEVKESIDAVNSNLDELSYSDNGIENLCNPNKIERGLYTSTDTRVENYFHYEIEVTPNEYYSRTRFDGLTDYSGYCFSVLDENKNCIVVFANNERTIQIPSNGAYLWLQGGESAEQLKNMKYMVVKLQTPPTDYKPYIPSVKMLADKIYNNTKVDVVLYDEFDTKVDNIQNKLYLLGDILFGSLYFRFDEEHNPFAQGFDWVAIADVPQITSTSAFYNCISYAEILDDNDYAKGDVRIFDGKLQIRIRKQPTVNRLNWYIFCNSICEKVKLAE